MKSRLILVLILFFLNLKDLKAQTISKKEFRNTEWFSKNSDSLFFKADTIRMVKYTNLQDSFKGYKTYYESPSLDGGKFVKFQFKSNKKMNFWIYHNDGVTISNSRERSWEFDKKNGLLTIYRNGLEEWIFKPLTRNEISFKAYNENYETTEITLIRLK